MEQIRLSIRITPEQKKLLEERARSAGYSKLAFYIRSVLFQSRLTEEKIDAIYKKICQDGR